ncbi:sigma-70 family RNA polymerase sigma factor [Asanoa sp. WMMD1127]|uniref:sigma-70 family RNA polymerase sigma factor n=1 Tax=Asanoa sp. WMMD1127 TaxID=3016107 RepID=UPI00241803D1|nr:sigma-70 family RNA polymerase sigma factor [Asanoa sp. WMMD1127]MDG4826714.1 sigma-70 family RNA polymerase sigma factor [Asanoa sp. WMMD1127]
MVDAIARTDRFESVYTAHYAPLVRLAYITVGSMPAAEDVVQEAFVDWYRRIGEVDRPAAYLRRAVASRCTSWVRRRVLERRHAGTTEQPPALPPDPHAVAVRRALGRLNPRQRVAVFLRFYLDLSVPEVAEALDCPLGTAKSLLHRGLAVLQSELEDR